MLEWTVQQTVQQWSIKHAANHVYRIDLCIFNVLLLLIAKKKQADEGALSLRIGNANKEYDARCPIAKEFPTL